MNHLYSDEYLIDIKRRIDELANNNNIEQNKFVPMEILNFVNEIKRLYFREKELKHFNDILEKQNLNKLKEIERLNNIINELESHLEQQWLEWKDCETDVRFMANEDKCILEKLRELKGVNINE